MRRFLVMIPLLALLGQPAPAHIDRAVETGRPVLLLQQPVSGLDSSWNDTMAREMQATLIADGLMLGRGWTRADCVDTLDLVGAPANKSFSFCYKYESTHSRTLAAIERIFHENRTQWEELGWTQFPGAVGGVYQSTWDPQRYVVVIVGGYHSREGYTDVIVGVAKERS
jgi:hypothetical protein